MKNIGGGGHVLQAKNLSGLPPVQYRPLAIRLPLAQSEFRVSISAALLPAATTRHHRSAQVKMLALRDSEELHMTTEANDRMNRPLDAVDPQIADLLREEAKRQATTLELIPSENLVSEAVLEAMGSIFTNKYAEGYPGKRYYGGCEYADKVEQLAIDRAKELF